MNDASREAIQNALQWERDNHATIKAQIDAFNTRLTRDDGILAASAKRIAELEADLAQPEQATERKRVLPPDGTPGVFIGYEAGGAGVWLITWSGSGWKGESWVSDVNYYDGGAPKYAGQDDLAKIIIQCDRVLD